MTERERYIQNINAVYNALPQTELLAQFSKQCSKTARAAEDLKRELDSPLSDQQAAQRLLEEFAGLSVCWDVLDVPCTIYWDGTNDQILAMHRKAERWRRRLEEQHETANDCGLVVSDE